MNKSVVYIVAIVLIALGVFGLARGKFNYTDKHEAQGGQHRALGQGEGFGRGTAMAVDRRDRRRRTAPRFRPPEIGTDARPTPGRFPWES